MKQKKRNSFAVLGYTKNMMAQMVAFTAAANAIFAGLIIAHRMRTVDKIVVLKDGRVAENGTPAELKKAGGIYKHMADMQLSSEQWKYQ